MTITVRMNTTGLNVLQARMGSRAKANVDQVAEEIRMSAFQMAPRDTGSLAASIYINNGEQTDYYQRTGEAASRNSQVYILELIRPEFVMSLFGGGGGNPYVSVVGVAAGHGIFQELGTRYQAPQPYMTPAVEPKRDVFVSLMTHVADL